jgi:type IV pilus assembly protein PilC
MKYRIVIRKEGQPDETRTVEAESRFKVYEDIHKEGGYVMNLVEKSGGMNLGRLGEISIGTGVKTEDRIAFTKNLAAMLSAGLTLSRALSVIERQSHNKFLRTIVSDLEEEVKKGTSFHDALAKYPKVFNTLFISMVKAGEESGTISQALGMVAKQMDRSYTLTKKVRGAMIYPSIILCAIVIISVLMLMYVVPTLSSTFKSLGVGLPFATRVIVGASDFMAHNAIIVFIALAAFFGGIFAFVRSKTGGRIILAVSLKLPVIGQLVQETFTARAARSLASLLASGVEMLTAIGISKEVVGDNPFGKVLEEAETRVRKGEPLSAAFADHANLYPFFFGDMISVGEETGKVADMLGQVAEYYETNVEEGTKDLSTIIEPMLMLVIGVAVGIFALAMIAPIYSLSSKI